MGGLHFPFVVPFYAVVHTMIFLLLIMMLVGMHMHTICVVPAVVPIHIRLRTLVVLYVFCVEAKVHLRFPLLCSCSSLVPALPPHAVEEYDDQYANRAEHRETTQKHIKAQAFRECSPIAVSTGRSSQLTTSQTLGLLVVAVCHLDVISLKNLPTKFANWFPEFNRS
jgi:hypothetical protein